MRVGAIFLGFYWSWYGAVLRFQTFSAGRGAVLRPTGSGHESGALIPDPDIVVG